jgi:hypothetical protein
MWNVEIQEAIGSFYVEWGHGRVHVNHNCQVIRSSFVMFISYRSLSQFLLLYKLVCIDLCS